MIKLIASDVDGTILQNGAQVPSPKMFELIRECTKKGIWFVVASGRQYPNLRRMFAPVWEDIVFVPENGALVMYRENVLFQTVVPRSTGLEIIDDVEAQKGCQVMLSGRYTSYVTNKDRAFADHLVYDLQNTMTVLDDVRVVEEPFYKVSAFVRGNAFAKVGMFKQKWGENVNVTLSGEEWIDFGMGSKGTALQFLQLMLGMETEEMAAFGDNYNDVLMFQSVGHSYLMQGAAPALREYVKHVTPTVEEELEAILKKSGTVPRTDII